MYSQLQSFDNLYHKNSYWNKYVYKTSNNKKLAIYYKNRFDENYICNSSDENGRYTYKKQPEMCHWNLVKFAEAIQVLVYTTLNKI